MSTESREHLFEPFTEGYGVEWLEHSFIPQSLVFYGELLPIVYGCCQVVTRRPVRLCDIGAGSGAGSNLILNALSNLCDCPVEMTSYDLERRFSTYATHMYPRITYKVGDFFNSNEQYDIAILSHTLEHILDPEDFLKRLTERVPITIIYVPYRERNLITGHVASFDRHRIEAMPGMVWGRTFRSMGWWPHSVGVAAFVCLSPSALQSISILQLTEELDAHFRSSRLQSPQLALRANVVTRSLYRVHRLGSKAIRRLIQLTSDKYLRRNT